MNKLKLTFSILAIILGICMFVYGGYDDSPGGQVFGFIMFIIGVVSMVKNNNKTTD